ncbi:isoprenylcysteine carboxylmethyltransferase family protein [Caloramator sp. mosi_1]|uniref:isoprenylcysteine carboxylmethyltransferase family protein n=1 Tax=Caloramator sp. mosi_1 TaxID=3023090 RepID=UPI003FCD0C79
MYKKPKEIVKSGVYKYLKHPLYIGLVLNWISINIFIGNVVVTSMTIVTALFLINIRIKKKKNIY